MCQPPDRRRSGPPRGRAATVTAPPPSNASTRRVTHALRLRLDAERFGQPSNYSLARYELARHVRQLRRSGWQSWEIRVRFDYRSAA